MASLHVAFTKAGAIVFNGLLQVADGESVVSETVTTSGTNAQSAACPGGTVCARVVSDVAHWIAIGSNPNAQTGTATRLYLPANVVEYFQIEPGNKVAGITA
jgi:hypothetical protein